MVAAKLLMGLLSMLLLSGMEATPVDPTDQCIFSCYRCYSRENLVGCANACIATAGAVGDLWSRCGHFDGAPEVFRV